jgi:hypothetical protein
MIFLPFLISFVLMGCSSSDNQGEELVLGDGYDEKPGDVFTTSFALSAVLSNGQSLENSSTDVKTYTLVTAIPSKYGYSNAISGPYLLESTNEDGILDGLEYMTESGDFIIDDDMDYFTNIEYTTESGNEEPENIYIGDKFSFSQNSTLFDSQSGIDSGYEITSINFSVLKEEQVTVPAGSFNAVKIGYSISSTTSTNNIIDTISGTGYGWFDTTNGFMLKLIIENGNMSLGEQNVTATFSAETILQSYSIAQSNSINKTTIVRKAKFLQSIDIKPSFILQSFKQGIQKMH